ncbi:MAG: DMT family transporter [Saprospiraceae bacterium]
MKGLLILIAFVAGAILPVQASINAKMAKFAGGPVMAALLSFAVGTIGLLLFALFSQPNFSLQLANTRQAPAYAWIAGILGAFYVVGSVYLLPKLGVALTFSLIIAGQMLVTLVLDHYGLLGVPVKPINLPRLLGILLIIAGVILVRKF